MKKKHVHVSSIKYQKIKFKVGILKNRSAYVNRFEI